MRPGRRNGIASLPVTMLFIALATVGAYALAGIGSSQSSLANSQISAENTIAARQGELSGLLVTQQGSLLRIAQSSGIQTTIVNTIVQAQGVAPVVGTVDYMINPGQSTLVNVTQIVRDLLGGQFPSLGKITLVTNRGVYIMAQFQTRTQVKQVTTYQQQSVQKTEVQLTGYDVYQTMTGQRLAGYNVYQSNPGYYSCPSGTTLQGSACLDQSVSAAQYTPPYYTCPYLWSLIAPECTYDAPGYWSTQTQQVYISGYWNQVTQWAYQPGYWTTEISYEYGGYWTYEYIQTGGYWSLQWVCDPYGGSYDQWNDYICFFQFVWVPTYSVTTVWHPVVTEVITYVYNPGYWYSYITWSWVPGYWVSYPVQVWNPPVAYIQTATYHVGYYTCNQGTLSGSVCITSTSTPATWYPPATTDLGPQDTCPSGSQYSCSPLYQQYQYAVSLGQMQSCPSGISYSCIPVYISYNHTVSETVPVTQTISYRTISVPTSAWQIGG